MAQAPATPKFTRLIRRAVARLGGTAGPDWQPSEQAALALRRVTTDRAPADQVVFLIPLVGAHQVGDWTAVCSRLSATLRQFQRQSDARWQAVICSQTQPPLPQDSRLHYLPFNDPTPGNDKWHKLATLGAHLPQLLKTPAYVMSFDADDLLHPQAVADMLGAQKPGYVVRDGYVRNHATGAIGLAAAPTLAAPLRKPFWKLCGSCTAVRVDPNAPESLAFVQTMSQHEHRMFPYLARLAGHRLTPLPRPSVLYELNHGENFGARRGRVSFKARFVERFRVTHPETLAQIKRDFDG